MMRLLLKKQICMEGGYMLSSISSGSDIFISALLCIGGLFGIMLSFYLVLCFIQWVSDVIEEKRWQVWKEWIL